MPLISRSIGQTYDTKYKWPCKAQCGGSEVHGWFFEAFPDQGMIRSDSKVSLEEAEERAWKRFIIANNCPYDHRNPENLDRRNYKNGCSFCKHCGTFLDSGYTGLEPSVHCLECNKPTYYAQDKHGYWHCETHYKALPNDMLTEWQLECRHSSHIIEDIDPEQFKQALTDIVNHIVHNNGKEKTGRQEGPNDAQP
jgi:hypothetical protein